MSLTSFVQAVARLECSIVVPADRPTNTMPLQATIDAAHAIEQATGKTVGFSWRKSSTDKRDQFLGKEGAILRAFMKLIDPKASEAALVNDLRQARAELSREKSAKSS